MTTVQFDKIYHGLSPEVGKFRIGSQGLAWKALEGDSQVLVPSGDVKWAQWLRVARSYQLRVGLSNSKKGGKDADRRRETFDGFSRDDHEKLSGLLKQHCDISLETKDITFKGWNWGSTDFQGQDLAFLVSNKTVFELPLSAVSNSNIAGKTEVSLEFVNPNPASVGDKKKLAKLPDELVEMRFYVPGSHIRVDSDDEEAQKMKKMKKPKDGEDGEESQNEVSEEDGEEAGEDQSAAQQFHSLIRDRASLTSQTSADALLVSFDEILVTTPRGRYDVDMYQTFLRLRGKTYDYKIMYTSITRLFLLPKDEQHVQFVIGLDPPIRQGQTRYSYLIMQFARDQDMEAEINMEEELLAKKFEGKLEKHYDQPAFQVVSSVFRALSGKKIIGQTRDEAHGIKCNLKANPGEMHLLEKSIIFIGKQPILIDLNGIHQVVFSRVGNALGTARTFDVTIEPQSGTEYTFNAVNRDEHEAMENYLKNKKVRVKNQIADDVMNEIGDDDDDDEEMQSVASSDEDEPTVRKGIDVDDEDSEEDADFQASSSDGGSPSESDSGGSHSGSAASGDKPAKAQAKTKSQAKSKQKDSLKETNGKDKGKDKDKDKERGKGKEKEKEKDKSKAKTKPKGSDVDETPKKKKPKPTTEEGSAKAKPKPKPKPKAKTNEDAMDVDAEASSTSKKPTEASAPSKAKPKPKPVAKKPEVNEEGPAKKKPRQDKDADV